MHGKKENSCLNQIKEKVFSDESKNDISDDVIQSYKYQSLLNDDWQKMFFAMTEDDLKRLLLILNNAEVNNDSTFPDFTFKDGFIEHFQISSSSINEKGGYTHTKEHNKFCKGIKKQLQSDDRVVQSFIHPEHNYDYLEKSFRRTWESHIAHLEKYSGNKEIGVFLVDYPEINLQMFEKKYENWPEGTLTGDYTEAEKCGYRLSRDKNLLKYIYGFREKIKYIIYKSSEVCEIISMNNIPSLLEVLHWDYSIEPLMDTIEYVNISRCQGNNYEE